MPDQGVTYSAFVEAELKFEYERRASLDARGAAIVTTSGGLVTLLTGLAALALGKDMTVTGLARFLVVLALLAFVSAGVAGIRANRLRNYEVTSATTLDHMLSNPHWKDSETTARNVCAKRNVITIRTLRNGNNKKADQITHALGLQVVAIALFAVALLAQVSTAPKTPIVTNTPTPPASPSR